MRGTNVDFPSRENPKTTSFLRPPARIRIIKSSDSRFQMLVHGPFLLDVQRDRITDATTPANLIQRQPKIQTPVVKVDHIEIAQRIRARRRPGRKPEWRRSIGRTLRPDSHRGQGNQNHADKRKAAATQHGPGAVQVYSFFHGFVGVFKRSSFGFQVINASLQSGMSIPDGRSLSARNFPV